jgi:hypothetical protein
MPCYEYHKIDCKEVKIDGRRMKNSTEEIKIKKRAITVLWNSVKTIIPAKNQH